MRTFRAAVICGASLFLSCSDDAPVFVDAATDADTTDANEPVGMLPSIVELPPADCGGSSTRGFSVVNDGNATLEYTLALSDPAFTVVPETGTILPGATTTFTVTAEVPQGATAGLALTAQLSATTNLPGSPHMIPVTVTPRGAHVTITPPSVGFGQVEAGTTAGPTTLTVSNSGNSQATITISAPASNEFTRLFGGAGTLTLQGGQSAQASFTYTPNGVGADSSASGVTINGTHCGIAPNTIALSGTGEITGGVLVQGTPVDFGPIACGATSGTANVTLMNTAGVSVPFSATFITDPEGDDTRYSVAPASGNVPAGGSLVLTVTRNAIALPSAPRAYDATLRISTTIPAPTDTDVPVRQTLTGPFLVATPPSINFGYASVGLMRAAPITLQNTGNAAATLQSNTAAPFGVMFPALLAAGANTNSTATYAPETLGTVSGNVTVGAPGACSSAATVSFTAGDGPEVNMYTYGAGVTCPAPATFGGGIFVQNNGNQALSMTCAETTTTNLAPQFSPSPLGVAAGSSGTMNVTVSAGTPVRAGVTAAQFRCTTNEPVGNTHDLLYERDINGTDLTLSAVQPLDFTCFVTDRKSYTITSAATSTSSEFVMPSSNLVFPLGHDFNQLTLDPGGSDDNDVTAYGGGSAMPALPAFKGVGAPGGGGDPCQSGANPGDVVFTGSVGVFIGSGGSVCSVTPATLPVVLRAGAPQ